MPVLRSSRIWTRQPPYPVEIDLSSELSRGLIGSWDFFSGNSTPSDSLHKNNILLRGSARIDRSGLSDALTVSSAQSEGYIPYNSALETGNELTVICDVLLTDSYNPNSGIFFQKRNPTSHYPCEFSCSMNATGNQFFQFYTSYYVDFNSGVAIPIGKRMTLAFAASSGGIRMGHVRIFV